MRALVFRASLLLVSLASAASSDGGGPFFASDFLGTSHEVYDDDSVRSLVEGWSGQRSLLGDHGGRRPVSDVGHGELCYRGGQRDFSDDLFLWHDLSGAPDHHYFRARFLRDGPPSEARQDLILTVGSNAYFVTKDRAGVTGVGDAPFALLQDTWYILEGIHFDNELLQLRIWPDGETRSSPLVSETVAATSPTKIELKGANFDTPRICVDWVLLNPVPAPVLSVTGSCPGDATLSVSGATPNGSVRVAWARTEGILELPAGPCAGIELRLDSPRPLLSIPVDGSGAGGVDLSLPSAACGLVLQGVDTPTCATTAPTSVP